MNADEQAKTDQGEIKKGPGKGGRREGAGRPQAPVLLVPYQFRVPVEIKEILLTMPAVVRQALKDLAEKHEQAGPPAEKRRNIAMPIDEPEAAERKKA